MSDRLYVTSSLSSGNLPSVFELDLDTFLDLTSGGYVTGWELSSPYRFNKWIQVGGNEDHLFLAGEERDANSDDRIQLCNANPSTMAKSNISYPTDWSNGANSSSMISMDGFGSRMFVVSKDSGVSPRTREIDDSTPWASVYDVVMQSGFIVHNGIGCITDRLFSHGRNGSASDYNMFEMDPDTLLSDGTYVLSPNTSYSYLGGVSDRLYFTDRYKVYEIDPDTLLDLSSGGVDGPVTGNNMRDIGGTKAIVLSVAPEGVENANQVDSLVLCNAENVENNNGVNNATPYVNLVENLQNTNEISSVFLCNVDNIENNNGIDSITFLLQFHFIENSNEIEDVEVSKEVVVDPFEANLDFMNFNFIQEPQLKIKESLVVESIDNYNNIDVTNIKITTFHYGKIKFTRKNLKILKSKIYK